MFWGILTVAVVGVIQSEPVRCGNHLAVTGLVLATHLSEVLVLSYTKIPAVTVPTLELGQIVNAIRGRLLMAQLVQRYPGPLRT